MLVLSTVILIAFPDVSIAHANYSADLLNSKVILSASGDFELLGGRNKWVEYIESSPAYWSILNIPITCKCCFSILLFG